MTSTLTTATKEKLTQYQRRLHQKCLDYLDLIDRAEKKYRGSIDYLNEYINAKPMDSIRWWNNEDKLRNAIHNNGNVLLRLQNRYDALKNKLIN